MRRFLFAMAIICLLAGASWIGVGHWPSGSTQRQALAATTSPFPAGSYLQVSSSGSGGGMAQYGFRLQQTTSSSATLQALSDWNTYIVSRSETGIGLTTALISRLATADWNARQAGSPAISAQLLAEASNDLINTKLATMTRAQQESVFEQNASVLTSKGRFALNYPNDYVSATLVANSWTVSVDPQLFSVRKDFFKQKAPGMVTTSTNFYPGEAILVLYSVASGDMGFGGEFVTKSKKVVGDFTGLDMTSRYLHGDHGYLCRRPLAAFFTEQSVSTFFARLSF